MKEADFYEKLSSLKVRCTLCPHYCTISNGKRGLCGVRENREGKLLSLVYGKLCSRAVDPIEKKPLFHFLPGTSTYSIATVGCNLSCKFCQNWEISQSPKPDRPVLGDDFSADEIVEDAIRHGCKSISYTYTDPVIFLEYVLDVARLAKRRGLKNIMVTSGYISPDAIKEAARYIDAVNIDLKGFTEEYYRKICGASLKPVLDSIRSFHQLGVWVEITTLIVPGHNDSKTMLQEIASFIASVDKSIPWHVSRFHPSYKMLKTPITQAKVIEQALEIGKESGIKYCYSGNLFGNSGESTYCPYCNKKLITRVGYNIIDISLKGSKCPGCRKKIDGVFLDI